MVDYRNSKLYRVANSINDKVYVGITTLPLPTRWSAHRAKAKRHDRQQLHQAMRALGVSNFRIELIRAYPCNSKDELEEAEQNEMKNYPRAKLYNTSFCLRVPQQTGNTAVIELQTDRNHLGVIFAMQAGTRMLEDIQEWARRKSCVRITLQATIHAVLFYLRFGFVFYNHTKPTIKKLPKATQALVLQTVYTWLADNEDVNMEDYISVFMEAGVWDNEYRTFYMMLKM